MSTPPPQQDFLRELIENLDQFREATVETLQVLHRKQKQNADRISVVEGLVWLVIIALGVGFFAFLIFLLTGNSI